MKTPAGVIVALVLCLLASPVFGQTPANDQFASPQVITGVSGSATGTNVNSTLEPGEPTTTAGFTGAASVWYDWIAPASGTYTFRLTAEFDSQLAVYSGFHVGLLTSHGESDPRGNGGDTVTIEAFVNNLYRIRVTGYSYQTGIFDLTWSGSVVPGLEILHSFSGDFAASTRTKGSYPNKLVEGSDGNFYGTTDNTGVLGNGTVFKMTPEGQITTFYVFPDRDFISSLSSLVEGTDGFFYGFGDDYDRESDSNSGFLFRVGKYGDVTTIIKLDGGGGNYNSTDAWQNIAIGYRNSAFVLSFEGRFHLLIKHAFSMTSGMKFAFDQPDEKS